MIRTILVALLVIGLAGPAAAQSSLAEAQRMELVGERPDGLVGIVTDSPSAQLDALVQDINAQRLARYREIAQQTQAPLEAVQMRAGSQIIERVPSGQWIMTQDGAWTRK